jgi:hypothetical protein
MERSTFEFHIARAARDRYGFTDRLFSLSGNAVIVDLAASRDLAHRMNAVRAAASHPDRIVNPGALNAMGVIDEITHLVLALYRERRDPRATFDALEWFEARLDARRSTRRWWPSPTTSPPRRLSRPPVREAWLAGETAGIPHRAVALEELITVSLANLNSPSDRFASCARRRSAR